MIDPECNKNVFQLWKEGGEKLPFKVIRWTWNTTTSAFLVTPGNRAPLFFHTALTREAARSRPARLKWSHLLNTSATTLRRYSLNILKELGKV